MLKLVPPVSATVPRVLFVDDNAAAAHALRRLLPCRLDCVIVTSSLHALIELEKSRFDLIVADLFMPGMLGSELLTLAANRWPDARRVLLTGYTSGHLLETAKAYADAVLDKVLETEILTEKICQMAWTPRR